jgi:hypothetical protein
MTESSAVSVPETDVVDAPDGPGGPGSGPGGAPAAAGPAPAAGSGAEGDAAEATPVESGAEGDAAEGDAAQAGAEPPTDGGAAAPVPVPASGRVSPLGRKVRLVVASLCALALLYGTFWGADDHFPFGPFKMYANANKPDGVVRSARLEAVNVDGERFKLTDNATGLRRAEIEGQMPRFREDGSRLRDVADAYEARHPDRPELLLVEILQRQHHLVDGQPTGEVTERQVAYWVDPDHAELADYEARRAAEIADETPPGIAELRGEPVDDEPDGSDRSAGETSGDGRPADDTEATDGSSGSSDPPDGSDENFDPLGGDATGDDDGGRS